MKQGSKFNPWVPSHRGRKSFEKREAALKGDELCRTGSREQDLQSLERLQHDRPLRPPPRKAQS